ncbi:MAG: insulinase family protein [Bacteroidales bacterium]|nr:insulinase family protein [Bacteroidales bacterium]
MRSGRSESGLQYAVKSSSSKVGYCSLSIKCGTRAEGDLPEGTAHFVEHTIFKGTKRKSAATINSYLERLGGELNAYTTKEEIVLHATVLREDIWKAVGLLLEIATEATFPEHEVETERGVVLDEIISYKDSPSEDIFDNFESRFFAGSPLGRLTLGTQESIAGATVEDLRAYYKRNFIPQNMALCIVASGDEEELEKQTINSVNKYLSGDFSTSLEMTSLSDGNWDCHGGFVFHDNPVAATSYHFDITEDKDNHEVNVVIGTEAPSLYELKERVTAVLLANILGGPASNSLLGAELREKHGWVYSIECGYVQYSDTGLMTVSLGCDKANLRKCLNAIKRIITKVCSTEMSPAALKAAKKQLLGQLAISADSGETQCLSMGKSLLAFGEIMTDKQTRELIESISAEDLRSLAARIFAEDKVSRLIYL